MVILNDDCLNHLKDIKDNSVDLVLTDPPYNIKIDTWDNFGSISNYVEFMTKIFKEVDRILKKSGSFVFFHNDFEQMSELQISIKKETNLHFKNLITWYKPKFRKFIWCNPGKDNSLHSWFNICEYILVYTKHKDTGLESCVDNVNNFVNLRKYFYELFKQTGCKSISEINKIFGNRKAEHCFYVLPREENNKIIYGTKQFELPTEEVYLQIINKFNLTNWKHLKSYKELQNEYKTEYEKIAKTDKTKHYTAENHNNLWTSNINNRQRRHPCEKPVDLLERIIKATTDPQDTVLDMFMGVGSTGVACRNLERNFIGIERDVNYFKIASERLQKAE